MDKDLKALEGKVFKQIDELKEDIHRRELEYVELKGIITGVKKSQEGLKKCVTDHMNKEEKEMDAITESFKDLDNELRKSFKERDQKIVDLQIESAKTTTKIVVYTGVVVFVISIIVQILIKGIT